MIGFATMNNLIRNIFDRESVTLSLDLKEFWYLSIDSRPMLLSSLMTMRVIRIAIPMF